MPNASDLSRVQRWMQAVITHPSGVEAGCASDAARTEIEVDPLDLERIVTRSRSLPAVDRLAVYANAYYSRLLECLREEYPALVHTLGEELFDEFAVGYLEAHPSNSYTLHFLGSKFPQFLEETCPAGENPRVADFMVDLAKLERLYSDIFDGPGNEGNELICVERLSAVPPEELATARLVPAPDLHLIELRSPVHEYIRAVRRKQDPSLPEPAETLLAVHRRDYVIRRHVQPRVQFVLLQSLIAGNTVQEAIAAAAEFVESEFDEFAASLRNWFRDWAAEGFFRSIEWSTS